MILRYTPNTQGGWTRRAFQTFGAFEMRHANVLYNIQYWLEYLRTRYKV